MKRIGSDLDTCALTMAAPKTPGEYPMTSTRALESFRSTMDRLHRGRNVVLAFLMQVRLA